MFRYIPKLRLTRSQFELAKFTFYLLTPISIMYYVGIDTDKKFNVPGFWPDPETLNKIPKEPYEIQAELARIRAAKAAKRARLEAKAKELGITPEKNEEEEDEKEANTLTGSIPQAPNVAPTGVTPTTNQTAGSAPDGFHRTLYQKLSESSHPIALLTYLAFRIAPLLIYLFGLLFTSNYILNFITVILLLAGDFWNIKNIAGRLMVGLRWWNEANELGQSVWVFESADPNRYINPIDSKVFWVLLYVCPVSWIVLGIFAILKFEFLSLILVVVAITLTTINAMAYTKCDKFGKANTFTSGVLGNVTSSLLGSVNPLAFFSR
ncbi:hypothetical protein CANARDRAFT_6653 [[Candida] arabinofermentans NRRL YB-2248]|uniref:Golgi apparatus membrane protein TVP23 n=1 Tax=[Candida] arabinofermentans NRRL YB-2248 TaxID=983967 RepID=A0A1E4T322_9ASCO|nr:hypothetical protein CANARDRAFT_6653 [[Candida] arabinofermentans NRRL YB-2248]